MKKNVIKLDIGSIIQKRERGTYYFRYQIRGERKTISLKTKNMEEAIKKAQKLIPLVKATDVEVISAHVKEARNLGKKIKSIPLSEVYAIYAKHPHRARPATIHAELSYGTTFQEWVAFVDNPNKELKDITRQDAEDYNEYLKTTQISVSTHNRKMRRIAHIIETLNEYYEGENPFNPKNLMRRPREEQGNVVRRLAFSREQEAQIRDILNDPTLGTINQKELKVIFYIAMYTGQRLKDCVLLQWQNVDLEKKRIFVKQYKTGKEVLIPMAEPLRDVLKDALSWKEGIFVCSKVAARYQSKNNVGKNIGANYVNVDIMKILKKVGLETSIAIPERKRKMTVYGFHSFRHSFGSHCAEAGVPKAVVESILGAKSEIIDKFYTHVGEEAQLKAIEAVVNGKTKESPDTRIKHALQYLSTLPESPEYRHLKTLLIGE